MAWLAPILAGLLGFVIATGLVLATDVGRAGQPVALVFPPSWDRDRAAEASARLDVELLGDGPFGFVVIVVPRSDDALADMRAAGAVLALRASLDDGERFQSPGWD